MKVKFLIGALITLFLLPACQQAATQQMDVGTVEQESPPAEEATKEPTVTPKPSPTAKPTMTAVPTMEPETESNELPPAKVINDEGGPVNITGDVNYTYAFFTLGVAEPVVILEDQAGFVDRNENFLMPVESQTLGQITSDFFTSPFSYSIALPIEPQGTLRDVDNDGEEEQGIQVFAIAYWTNTFGDPYLEERDLFGGGWSTAYASTLTSSDAETRREIVGGKLLIYAADENQGFPAGFGEDGLLFTADDPIVAAPQGYSVVDLDTDPFTFDRARQQKIDLIEPEKLALVDYSSMGYVEAFESLIDKLSKEYAFTEYKGLDWEEIRTSLLPKFEEAEAKEDALLYRRALRDLARSIPDGHVSGPQITDEFLEETSGGLGIAVRELDNGRTLVNFLTPGSPAERAGIALGAEIFEINGRPISEAVSEVIPHSAPFSTAHVERLQQLRYVTRFPIGTEVELTYRNPDSSRTETVTLTAVQEPESFRFSSLNAGRDSFELPVEYELLTDSGLGYVKISSFSDNELLTIQLWERLMRTLNENQIPGLIIDMRQNTGGSGFLADQMAAYFFNDSLVLGNTGRYDKDLDEFYFDPRSEERFYLPAEELRFNGEIAVLIGPNCNSACEFFSYDMTLEDRAAIVGQYPTAGLGGSIDTVKMPEGEFFIFTKGRAVDSNGEIHIEGKGVIPTIRVPVTEETLFSTGDPVLEAAITHLSTVLLPEVVEIGEVNKGDEITADLLAGTRDQYSLAVEDGESIDLTVSSEEFDPILIILDVDGNILLVNDNMHDGSSSAGFKDLEIPADLTLVLQVLGVDDQAGGEYALSILDSGNN